MLLPPDILWSAIDAIGDDVPTLKSLCITSKILSDYSQRRLVRHLRLTVDLTKETLVLLNLTLMNKPELATAVKSLSLCFLWADGTSENRAALLGRMRSYIHKHLNCLLGHLSHLQHLELASRGTTFGAMNQVLHAPFFPWVHSIASPHLISLSVSLLPLTFPTDWLSSLSQLRYLRCCTAPLQVIDNGTGPSANAALHTFEYDVARHRSDEGIQFPSLGTSIDLLLLSNLEHFIFGSSAQSSHVAAARVLQVSSAHLRQLTYRVPQNSYQGRHTTIASNLFGVQNRSLFQSLTALECVTIQVDMRDLQHDIRSRATRIGVWISNLPNTVLSEAPNLKTFCIHFTNVNDGGQSVLRARAPDWRVLDGRVSGEVLPALKYFRVVFELNDALLAERKRSGRGDALKEEIDCLVRSLFKRTLDHKNIELEIKYEPEM